MDWSEHKAEKERGQVSQLGTGPAPGAGTTRVIWSFGVLGPLLVSRDAAPLDPGPLKQRVLLAALLCQANTILPVEQLMEILWGEGQPRTARKNLQVYVSALRRILGDRIRHAAYGYTVAATTQELDLLQFGQLASAGRKALLAGDPETARGLLHQSLSLWRDRPMVDLLSNSFMAEESNRLMEQYIGAYEDWADLEISVGRHAAVVEKLRVLARMHPFRERLTMSLMTALCQVGNRREALAHYETHRQLMARELGLAPSSLLQQHYQNILSGRTGSGSGSGSGQSTAPARARGGARPAQLPRALPDFIGRREQSEQLVSTLSASDGPALAVIYGYTGTGKTALAVHVGHLLAQRFSDGQVLVAMRDESGAPRPWHEVLTELLRSTGSDAAVPEDEAAAFGRWRSWIADRNLLMVLDDAPDEQAVQPLLPGCGASATIVTGCRSMCELEAGCRIQLGDFGPEEALRLLEHTLGPARTAGAEQPVRRILARCGGPPLVVRMVASKLTMLKHLSLQQYADILDTVDDVTAELSVGSRSVRTRFDRVYRALSPLQRDAFRALGSLRGPAFSQEELLAALRGLPVPADHVLEDLTDASLVSATWDVDPRTRGPRYVMPTIAYRYSAGLSAGLAAPLQVAVPVMHAVQ